MPWFESWFDSPYYHILYRHRNEHDARLFLDHLLDELKPEPKAFILDLGCGRGRHSRYLNSKGFVVTGIDLSEQSIKHCLQFENDNLSFFVHDMRHLFRVNDFNYVFNLFTSFGYFDRDEENQAAIKNAIHALRHNGIFVIDYLNTNYVKNHLVPFEEVVAESIRFKIERKFENGFFIKEIRFSDDGNEYFYTEKVAGLELADFERYLQPGMNIKKLYGNYDLQTFDVNTSPRLVIIASKA